MPSGVKKPQRPRVVRSGAASRIWPEAAAGAGSCWQRTRAVGPATLAC